VRPLGIGDENVTSSAQHARHAHKHYLLVYIHQHRVNRDSPDEAQELSTLRLYAFAISHVVIQLIKEKKSLVPARRRHIDIVKAGKAYI
jgi:hypothetical protein